MEKERMATKTDNGGLAFCIIKLEPTRPFSFSCFIFAGKMKMRNTKRRCRTRGRNLEGIITTVRPVHLRDWRSFFTRLWWFLIQVRSWPVFFSRMDCRADITLQELRSRCEANQGRQVDNIRTAVYCGCVDAARDWRQTETDLNPRRACCCFCSSL